MSAAVKYVAPPPVAEVGVIVEYTSLTGETSPAILCEVVGEPEFQVWEIAAPPGLDEGLLSAVSYSDPPSRGSWRFIPKGPRLRAAPVNPYGLLDEQIHPHWFSATELSYWLLCRRKWGYRYLERIKGQNRFAKRGSATHGFIEAWLKYGIVPPEHIRYARLARAGLKYLPPPSACEVERRSRYVTRNGFQYDMSIDVSFIDAETGRATVLDHKTLTDFKWAMDVETLAVNYQALLYAAESFIYWDTAIVDLRWLYYKDAKKRPSCRKVETSVEFETVELRLDEIDEVSAEIVREGLIYETAEPLPVNGTACEQYAGCPYRESGVCTIKDEDIMEAYMVQSSIRQQVLTQGAGAAQAAANATQAAAPRTATPDALNRLRANAAAPAAGAGRQLAAPVTRPAAAPAARTAVQPSAPAARQVTPGAARPAAAGPAQRPAARAQPAPAPVTQQQSAAAAPARPMGALSRLHAQANASAANGAQQQPAQQAAPAARPAARRVMPAPAPAPEPELPPDELPPEGDQGYAEGPAGEGGDFVEETPATFDASSEFEPSDVNPPEQPESPTQDPDQLSAENAAVNPVAPKKGRGRPAGSGNVKPVSDEGHIYAAVYIEGLRHALGVADPDPEGLAASIAKNAVLSFRAI